MKYKMKISGSYQPKKDGKKYRFNRGSIIETEDIFPESIAENVTSDFKEERKTVEVEGEKIETTSKKIGRPKKKK